VKPFSQMTADEIAAHREAWKRGEAEIWRVTVRRPSKVLPRGYTMHDHEAPCRKMLLGYGKEPVKVVYTPSNFWDGMRQ